eukprot:2012159-Lingulodinium_polyedra.AAC.1
MCIRDRRAEDPLGTATYIMVDASVEHNRDYEHIVMRSLRRRDLPKLLDLSNELIGLWQASQLALTS